MLPQELTLHVGLQKTGTSLVQRSLRILRSRLADRGFVYIDRREMQKLPAYHGWRAFPVEDELEQHFGPRLRRMRVHRPDLVATFAEQLRELALTKVRGAIDEAGREPSQLLISNETLVGRSAPDLGPIYRPRAEAAIEHVVAALQPRRTSLVVYVRRQDTLIESQYMERIHSGETTDFAAWARATTAEPFIRFTELVERLARIETVEEVTVKPFEVINAGGERFVADLLSAIEADVDLGDLDFAEENPSYSAPALAAALVLNPHIRNRKQLVKTRDFLRRTYPATEYPRPRLLSDAARHDVLEMYADLNRAFFLTYLPDADPNSYVDEGATEGLRHLI